MENAFFLSKKFRKIKTIVQPTFYITYIRQKFFKKDSKSVVLQLHYTNKSRKGKVSFSKEWNIPLKSKTVTKMIVSTIQKIQNINKTKNQKRVYLLEDLDTFRIRVG